MQGITTIGLDIGKSVFQVHCVDAEGNVVLRRQLKRWYVRAFFQKLPPCLVGIEACASSQYWSRELQTLGHTERLLPRAYVNPYVKRHKRNEKRTGVRTGVQISKSGVGFIVERKEVGDTVGPFWPMYSLNGARDMKPAHQETDEAVNKLIEATAVYLANRYRQGEPVSAARSLIF